MKYVILHNIRSRHNVGAIFRTCDGADVSKIFLTGYTPAPIDRFGRTVGEIKKTSLGASEMVEWKQTDDARSIIRLLQDKGAIVVAVEQAPNSISLYDFDEPKNIAYVFGNEITGVEPEVLAVCDGIIEIPMAGQKESLNVSSTVAIILFQKPA
ncbi:RNA methyltransferase [Candidatus Kaiserbacteria bacterium CG_4_9_14_0_2_um_filter_41_32]|uniref:RNA methyltransferase n=1 Tax=Candidatus Kaiserbacteria bacterium CG_4_9_14_0_2_um_filter_41_32 TaxID=1974601 RepID=A0A2M8FEH5_9BACT|nr:MAG: RNA methyltransferase [Candidatus Kaiserbacteria bacterium CG_4_9_14_0_2_um_filter_41_32]